MRSPRNTGLLTFATGAIAIALAVVVVLAGTALRPIGTDVTPTSTVVVSIPPGAKACQPHAVVASGARALKLFVAASTGSARARIQPAGQQAGAWRTLPAGSDAVALPLADRQARDGNETVCLENAGPTSLPLLGTQTGPELQVRLADAAHAHGSGRVRIDSLASAEPVSAFTLLSRIPGRLIAATGSPLAPWLVVVGPILGLIAALLLLCRSEETDARR